MVGKGKPWPAEDERKLKDWFNSGTTDLRVLAFSFDGQYSEDAIRQKLLRLGLLKEVVVQSQAAPCTTTSFELPDELPSVEETLKILAAAMKALQNPNLKRNDILRLRTLILASDKYKGSLADYIGYRALEAEVLMWRSKVEALTERLKQYEKTANI